VKSHRQLRTSSSFCVLAAALIGFCAFNPQAGNAQGASDAGGDPESLFYGYATQYFRWRCDHAGSKSLYLNAIADSKAFDRFSFDWYRGLSEPRHFLRIGIGVTYSAKNYDGPLLIVGSSRPSSGGGGEADGIGSSGVDAGLSRPAAPNAIGSGPGAAGDGPADAPAEDEDPADFLKRYGGELAESLIAKLNSRRKMGKGKFGSVLKIVDDVVLKSSVASDSGAAGDSGQSGDGPSPEEFVRPQRSAAGADRGVPPMAAPLGTTGSGGSTADKDEEKEGDEGDDEEKEGDEGAADEGDEDMASEEEETNSLEYDLDMDDVGGEPSEEFRSVHPGVVCLNQGTREELLERAQAQAVDLLFVFDIGVRESRGSHYSMTNLRMIDLQEPEVVVVQSKAIRSDADLAAEDRRSGKNLIESEIDKIFEAVDQNYTASALPDALKEKPEHVANRVSRLVSAANDRNRLMVGAEVVGFFRKGLLGSSEAAEALGKLFEGGGELLLTGEKDDRLQFLKKILEESE
jgi:hypothetical protein